MAAREDVKAQFEKLAAIAGSADPPTDEDCVVRASLSNIDQFEALANTIQLLTKKRLRKGNHVVARRMWALRSKTRSTTSVEKRIKSMVFIFNN